MTTADSDPAQPLEEFVDPGTFMMFMTMVDGRHTSRPLTVAAVDGSTLRFLVDRTASWAEDLAASRAQVHATVADNRTNTFLALNGAASLSSDRAEVEQLWNPGAAAYFDGPEDPVVTVLRFEVSDGEYWDSPSGRLGKALTLLRAAAGSPSDSGDHGPIAT